MNFQPLHRAPPVYGNQDARSGHSSHNNLTGQLAASPGGLRLKKTTVKIVNAKAEDGPENIKPTTNKTSKPLPSPTPTEIETEKSAECNQDGSVLDALFARLNAKASTTLYNIQDPLQNATEKLLGSSSGGSLIPFQSTETARSTIMAVIAEQTSENSKDNNSAKVSSHTNKRDGMSHEELGQEYLCTATNYLNSLPDGNMHSVQVIKTAFTKIQASYEPCSTSGDEEIKRLKARYVFAVANYLNQVLKKVETPIKSDFIAKALQDNDGNMFGLCAMLVEQKYLSIDSIEEVTGLCKVIMDALPKPISATFKLPTDPMENVKTWPVQEKRKAPPQFRACLLKGVSGIKDINHLQGLVWGGRLESIAMPAPGTDFAVVKFLTPEGFEKYFKATENGIKMRGDKKRVIIVEKQASPSSINDVIRHCAEGDASRCVRATDAENDWSDSLLTTLAHGKSATKRDIDCIKRGKNARGRFYIEFRFASIYHALNFKRELSQDPDWEHCIITFATDPCEIAHGVRYMGGDKEDTTTLH